MSNAITEEIVRQIKDAEFFCIMADETMDCAHDEQLSLIVRYVHNGTVEERLLAMIKVDDTCAATLFIIIKKTLENHGLDVSKIRGQCYDGAANVSGKHNGLQARIQELSPSALFVHCYAHCLNLVLVQSVSDNIIARNFFGLVQNLYVFLETCSMRHELFQRMQKVHCNGQVKTLKKLSDTRWACRVDSIRVIDSTLPAIISTLDEIIMNGKKSAVCSQARGLRHCIDFEFVLSLKVSENYFL